MAHFDNDPQNPLEQTPLSKTQRKRVMEELQETGEALVALSADRLKRVDLPDDLRDAVDMARRMTRQDEARRRQMQYVGRLMRDVDTEAIRAALADARGDSATETARLHKLERLRNELLENESVLHTLATQYPALDLQHLRSLRRAALKEKEQGKPPRHYRAIFQLLKDAEQNVAADHRTPDDQPIT